MNSSTDTPPSPAPVLRDLVYRERDGFRPLSLDLHLPEDAASAAGANPPPVPVVVFVHGGGWRRGSRRTFLPGRPVAETFGRITARGWAVASVDVRLSGEARFPAPLEDLRAALTWIHEEGAAEHHLDPQRVVLWGESAGGHLASLAALDPDSTVRGVIAWYAPSDLATLPQQPDPDTGETRESQLLGGPVAERLDLAHAASPLRQVHPDAPPFLLAHGTADSLVPFSQSVRFAEGLATAGVRVRFQEVADADHMWRGLEDLSVVFDPALDALDAFSPTPG